MNKRLVIVGENFTDSVLVSSKNDIIFDKYVKALWDTFQSTEPESDCLFIRWLISNFPMDFAEDAEDTPEVITV